MSHPRQRARVRPGLLAALAVACVSLQFQGELGWSLLALVIWVSAMTQVDPRALRRLWLPKFWLFSLLTALACGILLGKTDTVILGVGLSIEGCTAGLLMIIRGAFLISLAAWATRIFGSARLQTVLARMGVGGFGQALAGAFALLPELSSRLRTGVAAMRRTSASGSRKIGLVREIAVELVVETARLAEDVAAGRRELDSAIAPRSTRPPIIALVGAPGSGKTTTLLAIAAELQGAGLQVGGISQPAHVLDGAKTGYSLRDLATHAEHDFAKRRDRISDDGLGFSFEPTGWTWASQRIAQAAQTAEVLVVDELGRLEALGQGHLPALQAALATGLIELALVAVRADCRAQLEERLGGFALVVELPGDETGRARARQLLRQGCQELANRASAVCAAGA